MPAVQCAAALGPCRLSQYCPCAMQARFVARVLSGRVQLPTRSQMHAQVQDFYDLLQKAQVPVRYTHSQVGEGWSFVSMPRCKATRR